MSDNSKIKSISDLWHNTFKKIVFKNIHELPEEKIELLMESSEKNEQSSKIIDEILEKSKEQSMEIIEQNLIQNSHQYTEFLEEISKKNRNQNQNIKKQLSLQFSTQVSELKKQLLEETKLQIENFTKQATEQNLKNMNQSKLENFENAVQTKQQNLQYIVQNRQKMSEVISNFTDQYKVQIKGFIEQISEINIQTKEEYDNLIMQNKKQISETLTLNRQQNSEYQKNFFDKGENHMNSFIEKFSKQAKQTNTQFIEQIAEQTNNQISGFMDQISEKNNEQNSIYIKQNSELIRQLSQQSIINHGTINEKYEELVTYQVLSTIRENMIIIKSSILVLEKLDHTKFKIIYKLYLKYKELHSEIPVLDVTRGMIIIKILFPPFFKIMLNNLETLKNRFNEKIYSDMINNIKECNLFFTSFRKESIKLEKIKKNLDSNIATTDKLLTKLIDIN